MSITYTSCEIETEVLESFSGEQLASLVFMEVEKQYSMKRHDSIYVTFIPEDIDLEVDLEEQHTDVTISTIDRKFVDTEQVGDEVKDNLGSNLPYTIKRTSS